MKHLFVLMSLLITLHSFGQKAYTPVPGSKERKEIMDLLRKDFAPDIVFKVEHLMVQNNWACVYVTPMQHNKDYAEPFWKLLQRKENKWTKVQWSDGLNIEDDFELIDVPVQRSRIANQIIRKYPGCPVEIFPKGQ